MENMWYIGDIIKNIPNIKHLELYLYNNNIGQNNENMKYLIYGIK